MRSPRTMWRWFRLEFNRRAHNRVYYDKPIAYRFDDMLIAHPSIVNQLRKSFVPDRPSDADVMQFGFTRMWPIHGLRIIESASCVERTWRWVRR